MSHDVIVIGGGAAGLLCAIEAGKRGRKVVLLEHTDRIGKKISISGGGRCNFTNINASPDNFISANPHFCKSALARYTPAHFISLVERHAIPYHEKKLGQLFCNEGSRRIIEMLLHECEAAGVEIRCDATVRRVEKRDNFEVETEAGSLISTSLVIATGGLSIPALGATDFGYRMARQFGLVIQEPRPALVPFTLSSQTQSRFTSLSGISVDSLVSCAGQQFRENLLVTHRGLSGPAVLQVSSYWQPGASISINLLPDRDAWQILSEHQNREMELANFLGQYLPRRFAHEWCALNGFSQPLKRFTAAQLTDIAGRLNHWEIVPNGTEGYKKAEVTAGGVATEELSSQTMEVRKVPGLYFIGEVVDVTGQLGGYNFQWAWASGYAAGQSA